jgi:hypothetical protein
MATFDNLSTALQLPAAPSGLTATADATHVGLSWAFSTGVTSYTVWRSTTSGGPYSAVATVLGGTTYSDTAITNGAAYYYAVSANNWNGQSGRSSEVPTVVPLPSLKQSYLGGSLTLSWQTASTFGLYGAANLSPPVAWALVGNSINTTNGISTVVIQPTSQLMFFRLVSLQ